VTNHSNQTCELLVHRLLKLCMETNTYQCSDDVKLWHSVQQISCIQNLYSIFSSHPLLPFQITIILGHFGTENVWDRKLSFERSVWSAFFGIYDEFSWLWNTQNYCVSHKWCHQCISQNNNSNIYHLEKYFPITLCEYSFNGKSSLTSSLLTCDPLLRFIVQYGAWNDEGKNLLLDI
jgi:hypothetical protein